MLTVISPAPFGQVADLAFPLGRCPARQLQALLFQVTAAESYGFAVDGVVRLAVGFWPLLAEREGERLVECWCIAGPASLPSLHGLMRLCRLTFRRAAQSGPLRIRSLVRAGHRPGQRLARMAGMSFAGLAGDFEKWEWSDGEVSEGPDRRAVEIGESQVGGGPG